MNKSPFIVVLATVLPLWAVAQNPPAKPAPKKTTTPPAASAPAPAAAAAPKQRIMTKEQLRRCLDLRDSNQTERAAVDQEQNLVEAERSKLKEETAALRQFAQDMETEARAIRDEQTLLREQAKAIEAGVDKDDPKEQEAKRANYNQRVEANHKRVQTYNERRITLNTTKDSLDARITQSNARHKAFLDRNDELGYNIDDWKAQCADRPYAEADEAEILKERAAAKR